MTPADLALAQLRTQLSELLAAERSAALEQLTQLLHGVGLPALGGWASPAQVLVQALQLGPDFATPASQLATLTAQLLARLPMPVSAPLPPAQQAYCCELFLLAAALPRVPELWQQLLRCHEAGLSIWPPDAESEEQAQLALHVRHALAEQQDDEHLKPFWLARLQDRAAPWHRLRRTELLTTWSAWACLFDPEANEGGAHLAQGLMALYQSCAPQPEGPDLLSLALWRLDSLYPLEPVCDFNVVN